MQVVEALSGKEALDLAMRMFDMTNVKVIHSTVTDTKVRIFRARETVFRHQLNQKCSLSSPQ